MAEYVAMVTAVSSKGLALWVRQGDHTKVVSYSGKYTNTPEYHVELSLADLDDIVEQYQTQYSSSVLALQSVSGEITT